jgi:TldD protein
VIDLDHLERILAGAARPGDQFVDCFAERRLTVACLALDGGQETTVRELEGVALRGHGRSGSWLRHRPSLSEATLRRLASPADDDALLAELEPAAVVERAVVERAVVDGVNTIASEAKEALARTGAGGRVHVRQFEQEVWIVRSDGQRHSEVRRHVHVRVEAVARRERRMRIARRAATGPDLDFVRADSTHLRLAAAAAEAALGRLAAVETPTGEMPVVLGPGMPATLLHEACGHLLEGDVAGRPGSAYHGRTGQRVGPPTLTLVDDPAPPGQVAHYDRDDEGEPGRAVVLIEDGVLRGCLLDRVTAPLLGSTTNGHARRSDYQHAPLPRMSATFLLPGPSSADEIVRETPRGLYVASMHGGDTDMGGRFHLNVDEGFLIEGGRLTAPVRGAMVSGYGPDVLERVDRVAGDLGMSMHSSACAKLDSTTLTVSLGQPTIRISALEVWGG